MLRLLGLFLLFVLITSSTSVAQVKKDTSGGNIILPPEEQRKLFHLPEGFEVELVAAEPAVINPITMALDEKGRMYVAEGHTYRYGPKGSPVDKPTNPIVRLDRAEDGKTWKRTVVAEGFDDPVMGMLIRDGKLWCTSCDHVYVYDIDDAGKTSNRKEILLDKNKAWNPFGFFVLEWGPDDLMYVSIGNHAMQIVGPTNELKSRGNSGIVMRMKPDGSQMEKLVEGLRVPYSFEYDPFGQLWLISNGQGNPDRHVKVLNGVDYQCYSRSKIPNAWLAGKHPLAPPCLEITNGARTQMLHYYGANFPDDYQGRQFGVNWGPHGVGTRNHAIEQFVPDERERITKTDNWLTSDDPRFRPTQLMLAPDGTLLVGDWYGRDDENDLTGRIWRVKYTGKDAPKVSRLKDEEWKDDAKVLEALGSRDHLEREKAIRTLTAKGDVKKAAEYAATSKTPMGAASALWVLTRIGSAEAKMALTEGTKNPDWKVRRLALRLLQRYPDLKADAVAKGLLKDPDPAVRLEALLAQTEPSTIREGLFDLLRSDASSDPHLRYEIAFQLAKHAEGDTWFDLQSIDRAEARLAGLIAIDIALYEQFPSKDAARKKLIEILGNPGQLDVDLLLELAVIHADAGMISAVQKILEKPNLPTSTVAVASKLLRTLSGPNKGIKNPWLELVKSGKIPLTNPEDRKTLLNLLPDEGPTAFGIDHLTKLIADGDAAQIVLPAAALARTWETKAAAVLPNLWKQLNNKKLSADVRIELAATAAIVDPKPDVKVWRELLANAEPGLAREIVRDFRRFPKDNAFRELLAEMSAELIKKDAKLKADIDQTLALFDAPMSVPGRDLKEYRDFVAKNFSVKPSPEQLALGRMAFERTNCAKCHLLNADEKVGPTLGGVGRHELNHVVESILEPSKVILTGYEVEKIETKAGKTLSGLVREKGPELTVINADKTEKVLKKEIAERVIQKTSIMPDGMEKLMSKEEFADLVSFLMTHKANVGPPIPKKK